MKKDKHIEYHSNGVKWVEGYYIDGRKESKWTNWWFNGNIYQEENWKNDKEDGLHTVYYTTNGQKWYEETYKDGERDGLWTEWYENGQKYLVGIYKDGNVISEKCWDEVGNEKDCINTY